MQGSGLNFTQGHYSDPLASLQASLGAGSMFAKTLTSMQQFDENQQKMDMMRQDRERQAKLDAEHSEDRAAQKKEIADNAALENAMMETTARADVGNHMMDKAVKDGTDKYFVAADDSSAQFKNFNHSALLKDQLAGIDRTKLDVTKQSEYDALTGAANEKLIVSSQPGDANYKAGAPTYKAATQYDLFKRANALRGLGDTDAGSAAAKALGITSDGASGIEKSKSEQNAFVNKYEKAAEADPLFGMSELDKIKKFEAQGHTLTAAGRGVKREAMKANTAAIAIQHKELNDLYKQRAETEERGLDKNLATSIQMGEMRMRLLNGESTAEDKIAKSLSSITGGDKLSTEEKYAIQSSKIIAAYGIQSKPEVSQNIAKAYEEAYKKGYGANEATSIIVRGLKLDGTPEEREKQAYKFDSQAMFKQAAKPNKSSVDSTDYASIRQESLSKTDAAKDALASKMEDLFLKKMKGGSSALAALDKQIYDIKRTPDQAFKDGSYGLMTQLETDHNLGGFGDRAYDAEIKEKARRAAAENIGAPSIKEKTVQANGLKIASQIIDEGEGTDFRVYKDFSTDKKTGKKVVRLATRGGIGIDVDDNINKRISEYNKTHGTAEKPLVLGSSPTKIQQQIIMDASTSHMNDTYKRATSLVGDLGDANKTDAISAAVTNMLWQFGDHSKPAERLAKSVIAQVKSGKTDDAIKNVMNSTYSDFDEKRAIAFATALKNSDPKATIDPSTLAKKYDSKLAAKRYNSIYSSLKTSGLDEADQSFMLSKLQGRFSDDKISGLKYKVDPLGMSSGKTYMSAIPTSSNDVLQNALASEQSRMARIDNTPIESFMSKQDVLRQKDPNVTWWDRDTIQDNAKALKESQILQARDNSQTVLAHKKANEFKAGEASKLQDSLNEKLGTSSWQVSLLKDYGYGDKYLLMSPSERLELVDKITSSPGYKLKKGLVH